MVCAAILCYNGYRHHADYIFIDSKDMRLLKDKKTFCLALAVLCILLLAAVALWMQIRTSQRDAAADKTAAIYQNGRLLRRIPLERDIEDTCTIESSDGGSNTIQISDGKIGIIDADCPDRLCVKMGMISSTAYPISCLPHKLVIQIEVKAENKEDPPIDAITR